MVNWFSTRVPRPERIFSTNGGGKNGQPHVNRWHWNSKWIKDLNVNAKPVRLLEEKVGVNLHDLGFGKGFLDMTPKHDDTKALVTKEK